MEKQKLSQAASEAKKAYYKAWRKKNQDKTRASNLRYWERRAGHDPEEEPMTTEAKAKALKQAGKTQREIAKELNLSLGTVNKLLKTD